MHLVSWFTHQVVAPHWCFWAETHMSHILFNSVNIVLILDLVGLVSRLLVHVDVD